MERITPFKKTIFNLCLYFPCTEPNFIFADVIRADPDYADGDDDDRIYFFFTEVSVEYEFLGKLMIPRIARVCKVGQAEIFFPFSMGVIVGRIHLETTHVPAHSVLSNSTWVILSNCQLLALLTEINGVPECFQHLKIFSVDKKVIHPG